MFRKIITVFVFALVLAACSTPKPVVVQISPDATEIRLTPGMATQVEIPDDAFVKSVVVGNPEIVSAERDGSVVNLVPKQGSGETNLIVRAIDKYREIQVYQYRVVVEPR
jgi:type IV secretory pathway VirB9-like protein